MAINNVKLLFPNFKMLQQMYTTLFELYVNIQFYNNYK